MLFTPGDTPVAVRQTCGAAFTGMPPLVDAGGGLTRPAELVVSATGVMVFVDPEDHAIEALVQAGSFEIATGTYILKEVRKLSTLANVVITIVDSDGTHGVALLPLAADRVVLDLTILKGQQVRVSSDNLGWVDLYVVKGTY